MFTSTPGMFIPDIQNLVVNLTDYMQAPTAAIDTAWANALAALPAAGGVLFVRPGTYNFTNTLPLNPANGSVSILGSGIAATTFTTTTNNIDGIKLGNTQAGGHVQLNNMILRDFTINLPTGSTGSCINVTGLGEGGEITNVKSQQGTIGFLLEDIDRCVFRNLEGTNPGSQAFVLRQGFNNTWGTTTFINCHSVLNTANSIGVQFDADAAQGSPNKFDRVSFINHHFFANPGLTGSVGATFLVGATGTKFLNCLYENTLRHNDIEAEVDAAWDGCSFLNTNFGSTPTTDGWFLNNFAQISIYDCNVQQMTNLFNGNAGSPRVGVWGINKNGGNITNVFAGSYGAKFGNDTVLAGDNILALGLNGQQYSFVFTHQLQGGPPLELKPNSDSTTGIKLENAAGTAIVTLDTTNQKMILNSSSALLAGTGVPNNANGANGDYYLRNDGGANTHLYFKSAGAWGAVI